MKSTRMNGHIRIKSRTHCQLQNATNLATSLSSLGHPTILHQHHHSIPLQHNKIKRTSVTCSATSVGNEDRLGKFFQPGQEGTARQQLFSTISPVYDELNDQLSFGMHTSWKKMTVMWSGAAPGCSALDVCCGSGDLSFLLADKVGPNGRVVGLDFSASMLEDAIMREKASSSNTLLPQIEWIQGDALSLPFSDCTFDAITMGYGLRNVSNIPKALSELYRVLKPGCRAAILDFNHSEDAVVDGLQAWLLENVVVPAAESKGVGDEYRYLRPSIVNYPKGKELEAVARAAGFVRVKFYEIGLGFMGVLVIGK